MRRAQLLESGDVVGILDVGSAVLFHGGLEAAALHAWNPLLDRSVLRALRDEHARLSEELGCLEELWRDDPDAPDVAALAAALRRRLIDHLERDERLVYRPLVRLGAIGAEAIPPAGDRTGADPGDAPEGSEAAEFHT